MLVAVRYNLRQGYNTSDWIYSLPIEFVDVALVVDGDSATPVVEVAGVIIPLGAVVGAATAGAATASADCD